MPSTLSRELETYEEHRDQLVADSAGKYVVINGDDVVAVFEGYADALSYGYSKFGIEDPFLVKRIEATERVQFVTRLMEAGT